MELVASIQAKGTAVDGLLSVTFDTLPDELLTLVLGLVDTRWLLTAVHAVCKRWNRLCREVRGVQFDLRFLKNNPRVQNGDGGAMLTMIASRWRWVDAVFVDGWPLTHGGVAVLVGTWPTLTIIRCGDSIIEQCSTPCI
jgi:hypothetical protein